MQLLLLRQYCHGLNVAVELSVKQPKGFVVR